MYYHPLILPNVSTERPLKTCRALSDVWFNYIERYRAVQSDAAKTIYCAQLENVRALSQAEGGTQFAIRLLAHLAVEPFRLAALVAELGKIAADTHRQTLSLLDSYSEESTITQDVQGDPREAPAPGKDRLMSGRNLQMMA